MRPVVAAWLMTVSTIPAWAQPRFEVASIRPAPPGTKVQDARFRFVGDRFEAKAASPGDLLDMLVGFQLYRVTGGPPWMRTDRYNIVAKADHEIAPADQYQAVMALLTERFGLQSHKETREVPGLVLSARRLPAGLKSAANSETYSVHPDGQGHFIFTGAPLSALTNFLSQTAHVPVVDETEIEGRYDFVVDTADVQPQTGEDWGDRVREAVEALGFRVEARRIPVEILVVERCERPNEN